MKRLSILILALIILLSLGCLAAKKNKSTEPTPPPEETVEQVPLLQQAQTKAIEAEKLNSESKFSESADAFETALDLFQKADKETPAGDSTKVTISKSIFNMYMNLGVVENKAGDYPKALQYIDKSLETDSLNTAVIGLKYKILKENMMDQAGGIKVLENYASRHDEFDFDLIIAEFYVAKNDIPTAINWYKKADMIKKDSKVTYNLGKYNKDLRNYNESNKYFEEYLPNAKPEELNSLYKILAANYKNLGNNTKAIFYFEKSLAIEPDPKVSLALFDIYYKAKNDKMIIKYANQVLQNDPTNMDVTFVRGMSKYNLKDLVGAKADFTKTLNDPKYGKYSKQYLDSMK